MIEGMKYDIQGSKISALMAERADWHRREAARLESEIGKLPRQEADALNRLISMLANSNDGTKPDTNIERHRRDAEVLDHSSKYILQTETYRLDHSELMHLIAYKTR